MRLATKIYISTRILISYRQRFVSYLHSDDVVTWNLLSFRTGKFGNTTTVIDTIGSTDVECNGVLSKAGKSSETPPWNGSNTVSPPPSSAPSSDSSSGTSSNSNHKTVIIAVCVSLGCVAILAGAILFLLHRKRRLRSGLEAGQDTLPRVFKGPYAIESSESIHQPVIRTDLSTHKSSLSESMTRNMQASSSTTSPLTNIAPPPGIIPYIPNRSDLTRSGQHIHSSSTSGLFAEKSTPAAPPAANNRNSNIDPDQRYAKIAATHMRPARNAESIVRQAITSLTPSNLASRGHPPSRSRPFSDDAHGEPDIIIQHQDGGIVQELPPPYLDHRGRRDPLTNDDAIGSWYVVFLCI